MRYQRALFFTIFLLVGLLLVSTAWTIAHPVLPEASGEIRLYSNQLGDDLRRVIKESFDRAEKSIDISIFNFSDKQLLVSGKQAEERGIAVTLFTDRSAYNPLSKIFTSVHKDIYLQGLMHRKIVAIDHHLLLIGSTNFTKESLQIHENLLAALDSSELSAAILAEKGDGRSFAFDNQTVQLWLLPQDGAKAEKSLIALLDAAQKSLKVAMFTWTSERFAKAVIDAHKRGIQVAVALDYNSSQGASRKIAERLIRAGIPLYHNRSAGLLHHKFALIDERLLIFGSANWTHSAFTKNAEIVLTLSPLTEQQRHFFVDLWHILSLPSKRENPAEAAA